MLKKPAFHCEANEHLADSLNRAAAIGFTGVELAGNIGPSLEAEVSGQVKNSGLKLLTVWNSDSLAARAALAERLGALYIAVDENFAEAAQLSGAHPGLQWLICNHIGIEGPGTGLVETDHDLGRVLSEYPSFGFLLDVGHLVVAGQSIKAVIHKYRDRLVSVHLTDWAGAPSARWRYGEGFCRFGLGGADARTVMAALDHIDFKGWCVLGQRRPGCDPVVNAASAADYLRSITVP